jgi:mannose-6-phosphate isomerase-like protein (cupin superfamily)
MGKNVKIVRSDQIEAVQPLKPGCHERWIFNKNNTPTDNLTFMAAIIEPGKSSGLHAHDVEECFYVLRGRGKVLIGDEEHGLEPDLCIYCPPATPHNFINESTCESLSLLAVLGKTEFKTTLLEK